MRSLIQVKMLRRHQGKCLLVPASSVTFLGAELHFYVASAVALLISSRSRSSCQTESLKEPCFPTRDIPDRRHQAPALAGGCSILSRRCFLLSANTQLFLTLRCNLTSLGAAARGGRISSTFTERFSVSAQLQKNHPAKILFLLV